jgi:peptidoglycan/LPS O-acetylase OafA/YrhL
MPVDQPRTAARNHNGNYRPEIDGLRALAVIAVIINHFGGNKLTSGYLGVDIFFVISGYVISASLMRQPIDNLPELLSGFYARRVKRILPALIFFVSITSILICLVNPTAEESLKTGFWSLFGASNFYLLNQSTNYFATSTKLNAFTHTWSLGVEEQFYLVYPIILWWCLRNRPSYKPLLKTIAAGFVFLLFLLLSRLSTGHLFGLFPGQMDGLITAATVLWPALLIPIVACIRVHKSGIINAIFVLSVLSAASLAGFLYLYPRHQSSAYFLMAPRFWELGAGSLLLLTSTTKSLWPNRLNKIISISAFIGLCLALFLPIELGSIATITVILLTCILIYSLESGGPIHSLLTHKYVVAIGLISYSLYLWHWGVLAISRWTIGIHAWSVPLQTGAMLLAAAGSYRYVETPLRRADWAPSRSQTIGIGLGLLMVAGAFLISLGRWGKELALDRRFPTSWTSNFFQAASEFKQQSLLHNTVDQAGMLSTLTHDQAGQELSRPRLYVFGDSHSNHYITSLKKALPNLGVGSASIGWQCGYISPLDINSQTKQWMSDCEKYAQFVDKFLIENLKPEDTVMLAHRWKEKKVNSHTESTLNHLAKLIGARGAKLLLIDDVPEISQENPLLCNIRPWRPFPSEGCFQSKAAVDADQNRYDKMVARIIRNNPNVIYAKLRDLYCEADRCGPYKGKLMLYRDTDHLTEAASRLGAQRIADTLQHQSPGHISSQEHAAHLN